MAGACTFAAIADWGNDLAASAWGRLGFTDRVPVLTTVWWLLVRVDALTLTAVFADWVCSRLSAPPPVRRVIAVDGKMARGAVLPEGRIHLLPANDTSTGVVLVQVQVATKSNEIPAFAPLLEQVAVRLIGLTDVVIVVDVLHAQAAHARAVAAASGHLYMSAKASQPTMFAQLKQLPWAQVPVGDQHRATGHGLVRPVPSRR